METLATLRTRAKTLSDLTDSDKISTAEWTELLNDGVRTLYDILVSKHEHYFETEQNITLVNQQSDYALPEGFMKLTQLDYKQSATDDYFPIQPWENEQGVWLEGSDARIYWNGIAELFYGLRGNKLRVLPLPTSGTLRLRYIPMTPKLVDDDDVLPTPLMEQHAKFIIWSAVADAKSLQEEDNSFAQGKMQEARLHIEKMTLVRDTSKPRVVQWITPNRGW